jgi:DNA-binding beta-propeller fold protein YncE
MHRDGHMMENISIRPNKIIKKCDDKRLFLPNGVAIFDDGNIIVADSGNDRICLFDQDGKTLTSIGGKGFGQYNFKEPVGVFVSPDQKAYVADWHNHRVVVYDENLEYLGEFGHYGRIATGKGLIDKLRVVRRFLQILAYKGSYHRYHFKFEEEVIVPANKNHSLQLLLKGLLYWRRRNASSAMTSLRMMVAEYDAIDKPNGVAFYEDRIYVSQKNSRCISMYKKIAESDQPVFISHCFGPQESSSFGRLGNITCDEQGFLYVCDEYAYKIWKLDHDFKFAGEIVGLDSGIGRFMPFSCCLIQNSVIVVCGCLNFQLIDFDAGRVLYCSDTIGELHGVAYDRKNGRLYVADRSNGAIKVFDIKRIN